MVATNGDGDCGRVVTEEGGVSKSNRHYYYCYFFSPPAQSHSQEN